MNNELKPCPLCGEKATVGSYNDLIQFHISDVIVHFVECNNEECLCNVEADTAEEVIRKWNTRHQPKVSNKEIDNNANFLAIGYYPYGDDMDVNLISAKKRDAFVFGYKEAFRLMHEAH